MSDAYFLFIGSCNRKTPYFASANGAGVSVYRFDEDKLEATKVTEYGDIDNPTYLSVSSNGKAVYANSEIFGWREGLITALSFDSKSASLTYLNMQPSRGSITAHNIVARDGKKLMVVNYGMADGGPDQSLVAFPFTDEDGLYPPSASIRQIGQGPDTARQERSHAHSVVEISDNLFVVADLGCDTLTSYRLEGDQLLHLSQTQCEPGSGPRHTALHPNGRFLYVLNELNSSCSSFAVDEGSGALTPIGSTEALPDTDGNHCSDIQISPDGRFLYGGNRGHDSISVFKTLDNGEVELLPSVPSGGKTPRNLALSPSGRLLFCANQDSDRISVFERDGETGQLQDTGVSIETGTPTCIKTSAA
ncbi:lactonase family protein [Rhizobium sp. NPDC090275]|uniref:lactonase family protein n=1 Tax=Rhizobium sp. NPDC090275 TaxID=3364498 RepID=UPI00383A8070